MGAAGDRRRPTVGTYLLPSGRGRRLDGPRAEMPNGEALCEQFARGFVTPALRQALREFVALQGRKACQTPFGV